MIVYDVISGSRAKLKLFLSPHVAQRLREKLKKINNQAVTHPEEIMIIFLLIIVMMMLMLCVKRDFVSVLSE